MTVTIVLIVLVVLALTGSLWWLLPSPSEQRRMKLRQHAFGQGLRVREARDEMKEWGVSATDQGMLMEYYLFHPEERKGQWQLMNPKPVVPFVHPKPSGDCPPAVERLIKWEEQPKDILGWRQDYQKYSFYWFERGDEEGLSVAIETLRQLRDS